MILNNDYCTCILKSNGDVLKDDPTCPRHHGIALNDIPTAKWDLVENLERVEGVSADEIPQG